MSTLDPTKLVQTRGGLPARIIATDRKSQLYPIVALVEINEREEQILMYAPGGRYFSSREDHELDLTNVPQTKKLWVNVYPGENGGKIGWCVSHETEGEARERACPKMLACVEVEVPI